MNYCRFDLRFTSPVHFGSGDHAQSLTDSEMTCCADTVFSALCHAALNMGGLAELEKLLAAVRDGKLVLSDLFPYAHGKLYLPKPVMTPGKRIEGDPTQRKKNKKLRYLPVMRFKEYEVCLRDGTSYDAEAVRFGVTDVADKAAVYTGGDANPYSVGSFVFDQDCGLTLLMAYDDTSIREMVTDLLISAGISGIGGKISAGYGKYEVEVSRDLKKGAPDTEDAALLSMLTAGNAERYMLLTTALPKETEMASAVDGAEFTLKRRGGFVQGYRGEEMKKSVQYFFAAGSTVTHTFQGGLYDVGDDAHPAYRYAIPLFMGVR